MSVPKSEQQESSVRKRSISCNILWWFLLGALISVLQVSNGDSDDVTHHHPTQSTLWHRLLPNINILNPWNLWYRYIAHRQYLRAAKRCPTMKPYYGGSVLFGEDYARGIPSRSLPCRCNQTAWESKGNRRCDKMVSLETRQRWRALVWSGAFNLIPALPRVRFARPYCGQLLAVAMAEHRVVSNVEPALRNLAHGFGNSDAALYLFYQKQLVHGIQAITRGWEGVQHLSDALDGLGSKSMYSRYLTSLKYWSLFPQKYVLVTQTDVMITRRVSLVHYAFNYIGAPWAHWGDAVGNGGFSFRRVDRMADVSRHHNGNDPHDSPEDLWFSARLMSSDVPTADCALSFSQEDRSCPDSVGCHQRFDQFASDPCTFAAFMCRGQGVMKGVPGYNATNSWKDNHQRCVDYMAGVLRRSAVNEGFYRKLERRR